MWYREVNLNQKFPEPPKDRPVFADSNSDMRIWVELKVEAKTAKDARIFEEFVAELEALLQIAEEKWKNA